MIPPVFITLRTVTDESRRFQVQRIGSFGRKAGSNFTKMYMDEQGDDLASSAFYAVVETPEEIDELIRKATEPYTAYLHRLFTPPSRSYSFPYNPTFGDF